MNSDCALDVVVAGNVGIDTNVFLPGEEIDFANEANFTRNLDSVGQAGGYSARGFAQLGKKTAFIGYVGDDTLGRFIREELVRDGVDTTALFVDPAGTSRSVNLVYCDGRRKNFYDGKSHMTLRPDLAICEAVLLRARLLHVHLPNWARTLLPVASRLGITISCDLQDARSPRDPYREDFVRSADILFLSAANVRDLETFLRELPPGKDGRIVVVGMAERGCALWAKGELRFFPPVDLPEPVVDTNGAGDGLAVGFLSSWVMDGYGIEESVLRGQIAARHTCAQRASSSGLINRWRLDSLYAGRAVSIGGDGPSGASLSSGSSS